MRQFCEEVVEHLGLADAVGSVKFVNRVGNWMNSRDMHHTDYTVGRITQLLVEQGLADRWRVQAEQRTKDALERQKLIDENDILKERAERLKELAEKLWQGIDSTCPICHAAPPGEPHHDYCDYVMLGCRND